jgi:hypothetical protein
LLEFIVALFWGRIRQGHGEQASSSAGERMRNIVALLGCRALRYGGCRFGERLLGFLLALRHVVVLDRVAPVEEGKPSGVITKQEAIVVVAMA